MFTCTHPSKSTHSHELVSEARICWFPPKPPTQVISPPSIIDSATERQIRYAESLNGSVAGMTKRAASAEIDRLVRAGRSHAGQLPNPQSVPARPAYVAPSNDPRLPMIDGLISMIPDGYFAVRPDESTPYRFIYFSRPKKGKHAGSLKFSEQKGSGLGSRYTVKAEKWASGRWYIGDRQMVDVLMLIVADYQTAMMDYARELKHCCRCNADLTDERSRWYGIGPECETIYTWVINAVNDGARGPYVPGVNA